MNSKSFYDGWYAPEYSRETNGGWRWMGRRGIVRLDTQGARSDMRLEIYGWVPYEELLDSRTFEMTIAVNGHVIETFTPPPKSFEHEVIVPRALLGWADDVDVALTVANTVRPRGDWRDLGFATTGVLLLPMDAAR